MKRGDSEEDLSGGRGSPRLNGVLYQTIHKMTTVLIGASVGEKNLETVKSMPGIFSTYRELLEKRSMLELEKCNK